MIYICNQNSCFSPPQKLKKKKSKKYSPPHFFFSTDIVEVLNCSITACNGCRESINHWISIKYITKLL